MSKKVKDPNRLHFKDYLGTTIMGGADAVYAGVMTGFAVRSYNEFYDTDVVFCGGPFVGCKFFFTEGVGLTAEMAYCGDLAPLLNAGLTFKF